MNARKVACTLAAGVIAAGLTASATHALAQPPMETVVQGTNIDPETQTLVSYGDLNLAYRADQRKLRGRIWHTATDICFKMNGSWYLECVDPAIDSTDDQVDQAIVRAKRQMAGLPVGPVVAISMVIGAH